MDVLLLRHCEAEGQEPSAPLTKKGELQALDLCKILKTFPINKIISSPYLRARNSVMPFSVSNGIEIELDDRLAERRLGATFGDDWLGILKYSFENLDFCFGSGESSSDAMLRGRSVIKEADNMTKGVLLIVTHGNLATLILKSFDNKYGFEYWSKLGNPALIQIQSIEDNFNITEVSI